MAHMRSSPGSSDTSQSFSVLLSGTLIPKNLTRVPKEQQALLDRKDSWSTVLKDSDDGPVNVPPKVLEDITYFYTSRTLPPPAQNPEVPASSGSSLALTQPEQQLVDDEPEDGDKSDASSDDPGSPLGSWSQSPERPRRPANEDTTPSPSIKSQIEVQSQAPTPVFCSQPVLGEVLSSPKALSSPVRPTPKRNNPPTAFSRPDCQRRRIDPFPSSSIGPEDELETAIPNALREATPPINRTAARLATTDDAPTSPPCGQGSMIPSTYSDGKSPTEAPNRNKRKRIKIIKFPSSSEEPPPDRPPAATPVHLPTIPVSQPQQDRATRSRGIPTVTLDDDRTEPSSQVPQAVQDTPGAVRTHNNGQLAASTVYPESRSSGPSTCVRHEGKNTAGRSIRPKRLEVDSKPSQSGPTECETSWQEAMTFLDGEWSAEGVDWLPSYLQHHRSALSYRSLNTLRTLTKMAIMSGIRLSTLWSEPDGCLYRAASNLSSGMLSFPESLIHQSCDFFQVEASRLARQDAKAPQVPTAKVRSKNQTTSNAKVVEDEGPSSPTPLDPSRDIIKVNFKQQPWEAFCAAYPSYSGSVEDFVKACMVIQRLRHKRALPRWLYDDFIRAFVDGYIPYVERHGDDETALSALQWYVEKVDWPEYTQGGVVTSKNLDQVFKTYRAESRSARRSLTHSSPPVNDQKSYVLISDASTKGRPASPVGPAAEAFSKRSAGSPRESARTSTTHPNPEAERSPGTVRIAVETREDNISRPESAPEQTNGEFMLDEPPNPHVDESKQRMTSERAQGHRHNDGDDASASVSTTQRQSGGATASASASASGVVQQVKGLSSITTTRPRSSNSHATSRDGANPRCENRATTDHVPESPLPEASPERAPLIITTTNHETTITGSQSTSRRPAGPVSATPLALSATGAGHPAGGGAVSTPRPGVKTPLRRSMGSSTLNFGPPSGPISPARSALFATNQNNRVRKHKKTEKDRERENEKYKAKLMKLKKKGLL